MNIIGKFQNLILDNDSNIIYHYSTINDLYVLHIYNKYYESTNIKDIIDKNKDKKFYKKLSKMLFDKNKKTKKACFNYEYNDYNQIYNSSNNEIINRFLKIEYTFILIDKKFNPISILGLQNNTIYNVCTNFKKRGKNYMTLLFGHVLRLIQNNKLLVDYKYNILKLTIKKTNPIKNKLVDYYQKFGFKLVDLFDPIYLHMYMQ